MAQESVAEAVLGIYPHQEHGEAILSAYQAVTASQITDVELTDMLVRLTLKSRTPEALSTDELERSFAFTSIGEFIQDKKVTFSSTFADWATYQGMMEQNGRRGGRNALMIGAISPLSARAFDVLAREVYGASQPFIIDITGGEEKTRHGIFTFGDGLRLPFRDESFDFVHTNQLLHMLEDPSSPKRPDRQRNLMLFREIARVLAPGGQLIMQEMTPLPDRRVYKDEAWAGRLKLTEEIERAMRIYKFGKAVVKPKEYVAVDFLWDPNRDIEAHKDGSTYDPTVSVYARKPEAKLFEVDSSGSAVQHHRY